MSTDKRNDEKVQDLKKTKIEADKVEQVKGGQKAQPLGKSWK